MAEYWPNRLNVAQASDRSANPGTPTAAAAATATAEDDEDDYDRAHRQRLTASSTGGWEAELKHYLDDPAADVEKDVDTVEWWSQHADVFPTIAHIALDVLPIPASSVPCERLFSRAKQVSTDKCTHLSSDIFEALQCLNYHWQGSIVDFARLNSCEVEEVDMTDFEIMVQEEIELYSENLDDNEEDYQ